jgi:hypothetical protein
MAEVSVKEEHATTTIIVIEPEWACSTTVIQRISVYSICLRRAPSAYVFGWNAERMGVHAATFAPLWVIGVSALHINDDLVVGAGSVVAQIRRRFGLPCRGDTQVVCGSKQSLRTTSLLYQVHGDNFFYPNTVQYIPRLLLTRASRCLKCSTNHHHPWLQCRHQMMMIISWMIGQKHLIVRFSPERS